MDVGLLQNILGTTLAALALWAGWKYVIVTFRAELRFELFAARRELFLMMVKGEIQRDDIGYISMRQTINGLLCSVESMSGLDAVLSGILFRLTGLTTVDLIGQTLDQSAAPEALRRIYRRVNIAIFKYLLKTGPAVWVSFTVLFTKWLLTTGVSSLARAAFAERNLVVRAVTTEARESAISDQPARAAA